MNEFKFDVAVTQAFQTSGGRQFGWRLVFWTSAIISVFSLIIWPMILPYYGDLLAINQANMQAILNKESGAIDNSALNALLLKMAPAYCLLMAGYWLAWVMAEAALHRKVLRGTETPKRPFNLGRDELLVFLSQLAVFGIIFLIYFLAVFFFALLASLGAIGVLLGTFVLITTPFLLISASVRLAPTSALSILNKKISVSNARAMTKGKFWTLFPAYLVPFLGGYILIYIIMIIGVGLVTGDANFFMTMSGLGDDNPRDVLAAAGDRLNNPLVMLMAVLSLIAYSVSYAIWMIAMIGVSTHAANVWGRQ